MKLIYAIRPGLAVEVEGGTMVETFKELAGIAEVFRDASCGECKSEAIYPRTRKDKDENEYLEMACGDCGATLSYGQNKKGGGIFPKRKDAEGKFDYKKLGWKKWGKRTEAAAAPKDGESVPF
jgi:hypothetical protein